MTAPDPTRQHHHPDPATDAIVWHARRADSGCLCGWYVLGASWAEHLAGIVRPLIEAETREAVARELDERGEDMDKAANAAGDRGNYEAAIRMGGLADTYREAARIARGSDG